MDTGLSGGTAGLSGKNNQKQTTKTQNLTKSSPNFTKIGTGYPEAIPKLFPKDLSKKITGLAGISDLVKRGKLGQERGKLKIDLFVVILQD